MAISQDLNQSIGALIHPLPHPDVVIIHEDFSTGLLARQLFEQLLHGLFPGGAPRFHSWEFNTLRFLASRARAVQQATQAPLVCVSLRGDRHLPVGVERWAEDWSRITPQVPRAMVLLLEGDADKKNGDRISEFLREAAAEGGAEFFLGSMNPQVGTAGSGQPMNRLFHYDPGEIAITEHEHNVRRFEVPSLRNYGINE
jgi:hypothetical protein